MSAPARTGSTTHLADREDTARRLLQNSVTTSCDPAVEIDRDAPLVGGRYGIVPERVSLYGTPLWDGLTEEQRITLSVHESCGVARIGLRSEMIHPRDRGGAARPLRPGGAAADHAEGRPPRARRGPQPRPHRGLPQRRDHPGGRAEGGAGRPHHHEMLRRSSRELVPFPCEQGIVGGPTETLWKRAHLIRGGTPR
ncbi:hypothetical protein GCM10025792_48590 [Pseudonocardia tropica]|uniref:diiron oxygenase n=1 Tax=Pseudonocardia tropica TaxID=681289 RepID=UPI00337ACD19